MSRIVYKINSEWDMGLYDNVYGSKELAIDIARKSYNEGFDPENGWEPFEVVLKDNLICIKEMELIE
mgnify:CR=1 FL=1